MKGVLSLYNTRFRTLLGEKGIDKEQPGKSWCIGQDRFLDHDMQIVDGPEYGADPEEDENGESSEEDEE